MSSSESTFDWNGNAIKFNAWDAKAFGVYEYQTQDQRYFFRFDLQPVGATVRIYILEQPDYGGRPTGGHSTHRLHDGAYYVCVKDGLKPGNVPDALSWAVYWAENTARYIETGDAFA